MRTYKDTPIPAKTVKTLDFITCDLCGKTTTTRWKNDSGYDATETKVEMRTGNSFSDCGSGQDLIIDICPECFTGKLIPWVEKQGGQPTLKDWDW